MSRTFVAAVVFLCVSLLMLVIRLIRREQTPSRILLALQVGLFVLGLCLLLTSIVMAILTGNFESISKAILSSGMLSFVRGVTDDTYGACVVSGDSRSCTQYCCSSPSNPDIKWRDCNERCTSNLGLKLGKNKNGVQRGGIVGIDDTATDSVVGGGVVYLDCSADMSLDAYCDMTQMGKYDFGACNPDEHKGPVTCACCVGLSNTNLSWWDCNDSCNSMEGVQGIHLPTSVCQNKSPPTSTFRCLDSNSNSEGVNATVNNNQTF